MLTNSQSLRSAVALLLPGLIALAAPSIADSNDAGRKQGVVLQITDNNSSVWHTVLNAARQIPAELGKDNIIVEIVAFGPGIHMLKFDSEVGNRLTEARQNGVDIIACGNTMKGMKLDDKDLHPGVRAVKAGAVEILQKHQAGWTIIRP